MKRRRHVEAIARLVVAELGQMPPRASRRSRRELAAVALDLDRALAREVGTLELVERCRDAHLSSLDADDGLVVLGITWEEIVARVDGYAGY